MLLPSINSVDRLELKEDIKVLKESGINFIHVDVMDGEFVPSITFGHKIIVDIKKHFDVNCDAHLMVKNPDKQIKNFVDAGADIITIHIESEGNVEGLLKKIKDCGVNAGISLNPSTNVLQLVPHLNTVDVVLVMSVVPGRSGQTFIEESLEKIKFLDEYRKEHNLEYKIEVDGGINLDNIAKAKQAGADMFVSDSALRKGGNLEGNIEAFYKLIR